MSVTQPKVKVLVDWTNNPIGPGAVAGNNFVDISSFVRLDMPVSISRGRQDNISAVQAGRCTFTVDNSSGRFTPGNTASPYFPGVVLGRRVQVSVQDESSTYHVRFDGMINEIDVNDVSTGADTTALFVCLDVVAYLNRYPELSCWTVEVAAQYGPLVQYVMNEPDNSNAVSDAQGNGPNLPLYTYNQPLKAGTPGGWTCTAPTATYQSGNSPAEGAVEPTINSGMTTPISSQISSPLPSVELGATIAGSGVAAPYGCSAQFQGPLPQTITVNGSSAYTLVCWVWPNVGLNNIWNLNYNQEIITLGNTRTGQMLGIEANTDGNSGAFGSYCASYYSNFNVFNSTATQTNFIGSSTWFGGPVMLAVVINGTTATLYASGNLFNIGSTIITAATTITIPTGTTFNHLTIGGALGGGNGFLGNISNACVYTSALTSGNLSHMGFVGGHGPTNTFTGSVAADVLNFADVPSYWTGTLDPGGGDSDYFDLTGLQPFDAITTAQNTELGLAFANAAGQFTFHSRDRRMGAPAPSVTLPAGSYNEGIAPKWNDQFLVNFAAIQNQRGGVPAVAQNNTSIAQYGTYANGSLQTPTTAAAYNWYDNINIKQIAAPTAWQEIQRYDTNVLADTAAWQVNTQGQPGMKLATITVDILSNKSGQNEYIAPSTVFGIDIDSCIALGQNLPWWPNSTEASELFIEGVNETYSTLEASVQFYTSPAYTGRAWIPGNATYGVLDQTARVGAYSLFIQDPTYGSFGINTFSATMNNSDSGATSNGYVAAQDIRGVSGNLQLQLQPPLVYTQQTINTQSLTSGSNVYLVWDTSMVDTVSAMNQYTNGATSVICFQEGWYEICVTAQFASNGTGDRRLWIVQNQTFALRNIAPAETRGTGTAATGVSTSAVIYCLVGDAIAAQVRQDSGSTLSTVTSNGGSHMSLRFIAGALGSNTN